MLQRLTLGLGLLTSLLLAGGCFITVHDEDPGGGGPGGGSPATGTGGGATGTGGGATGTGGGATGTGGGATGTGGAGGGGLPERCTLPPVVGPCDAAIPSYWHDPATGVCKPFTYGGCEGNANRFETLEACQEACHGGVPDMDACEAPGDCVLVSPGCCSACDPVDARAFIAIHRDMLAHHQASTGCGDVECSSCQGPPEPERTSQYFTAACERGSCVVLDVRESPLTQCSDDADCVLRDGLGCCEGCDGRGIVALNRSADIRSLVCSDDFGACPPCVPVYPDGMAAVCADGRCQPRWPETQ